MEERVKYYMATWYNDNQELNASLLYEMSGYYNSERMHWATRGPKLFDVNNLPWSRGVYVEDALVSNSSLEWA